MKKYSIIIADTVPHAYFVFNGVKYQFNRCPSSVALRFSKKEAEEWIEKVNAIRPDIKLEAIKNSN